MSECDRWGLLMDAGQRGDVHSYARLLTELSPLIRQTVQLSGSEAAGVEHLVQVILLSVHSLRHTYEPPRPFTPWLMAIIQHGVADAERRTRVDSFVRQLLHL